MKTEKTKSPKNEYQSILKTMIGGLIIFAGATALLKLSKIMIGDFKEMGM